MLDMVDTQLLASFLREDVVERPQHIEAAAFRRLLNPYEVRLELELRSNAFGLMNAVVPPGEAKSVDLTCRGGPKR